MAPEEVLAFLRRNDPSETKVELYLNDFADNVRSLSEAMQANNYVTKIDFDFSYCHVGDTTWDALLRHIAARVNLVDVVLRDSCSNERRNSPDEIVPFLLAIQRNPRVQIVRFYSLQLSGTLTASFLDAATSVTELEMMNCGLKASKDQLAIAAALQRNSNIQRLNLDAHFGSFMIRVLNSVASEESKSKLQSLVLTNCAVDNRHDLESFRTAFLGVLQPHSTLRSLELNCTRGLSNSEFTHRFEFETAEEFARLLAAVETSPLESFKIGRIASSVQCKAMIASIPKMQLRTLGVCFDSNIRDMKRDFVEAVKGNACLRTIVAKVGVYVEDWLDDNDRMKLISYSARNEFLAHWIENPTAVSKVAWPEYLDVGQTTGPDTVFGILRALAPSLGPFEGEQCRKRRRPDSPS